MFSIEIFITALYFLLAFDWRIMSGKDYTRLMTVSDKWAFDHQALTKIKICLINCNITTIIFTFYWLINYRIVFLRPGTAANECCIVWIGTILFTLELFSVCDNQGNFSSLINWNNTLTSKTPCDGSRKLLCPTRYRNDRMTYSSYTFLVRSILCP